MNHDGHPDLPVGHYYFDADGDDQYDDGKAYLLYGPFSGTISLEHAQAQFLGTSYQYLGRNLTSGDLNGDGWSDVVMDGPLYAVEPGWWQPAAHVFFGGPVDP